MKNTSKKIRSGFTLIEMLIVVAIIGILASVVIVGIGPAQKKARDARRAADLRQVQTALELYYGKAGQYPPAATWAALTTALTIGANAVVTTVPVDPTPLPRTYKYVSLDGTNYVLMAVLDDPSSNLLTSSLKGTVEGEDCDVVATYCLGL
ncbi:MAG: type II secretion system protein [Candidatus Liptonbacteria bacterium]|nr:type II secretion system protein [Candidatus Liptonbacteria bacterium]